MMRSPEKPADPVEWMALLAAFANRRILVVGDAMLDEYLWGTAGISPKHLFRSSSRVIVPPGPAAGAAKYSEYKYTYGESGTASDHLREQTPRRQ